MNHEKVKVSREVAEALELARAIRSDETITDMCISKSFVASQEPLNNLNPYMMVKILINGYEVEQTPEEQLLDYYNEIKRLYHHHKNTYDDGIMYGIRIALNMMNLKVKGITDTGEETE